VRVRVRVRSRFRLRLRLRLRLRPRPRLRLRLRVRVGIRWGIGLVVRARSRSGLVACSGASPRPSFAASFFCSLDAPNDLLRLRARVRVGAGVRATLRVGQA
jgi:hypothetical protein